MLNTHGIIMHGLSEAADYSSILTVENGPSGLFVYYDKVKQRVYTSVFTSKISRDIIPLTTLNTPVSSAALADIVAASIYGGALKWCNFGDAARKTAIDYISRGMRIREKYKNSIYCASDLTIKNVGKKLTLHYDYKNNIVRCALNPFDIEGVSNSIIICTTKCALTPTEIENLIISSAFSVVNDNVGKITMHHDIKELCKVKAKCIKAEWRNRYNSRARYATSISYNYCTSEIDGDIFDLDNHPDFLMQHQYCGGFIGTPFICDIAERVSLYDALWGEESKFNF